MLFKFSAKIRRFKHARIYTLVAPYKYFLSQVKILIKKIKLSLLFSLFNESVRAGAHVHRTNLVAEIKLKSRAQLLRQHTHIRGL